MSRDLNQLPYPQLPYSLHPSSHQSEDRRYFSLILGHKLVMGPFFSWFESSTYNPRTTCMDSLRASGAEDDLRPPPLLPCPFLYTLERTSPFFQLAHREEWQPPRSTEGPACITRLTKSLGCSETIPRRTRHFPTSLKASITWMWVWTDKCEEAADPENSLSQEWCNTLA